MTDLRPLLFDGATWYQRIEPPTDDTAPSVWFAAKDPDHWSGTVLSCAAAFARDHGQVERFRTRFEGIRAADLLPERATANHRTVTAPIWAIAHELIVGRFLERVLGWTFVDAEPPGHKNTRGEWLFRTAEGRDVFVEVKTVDEPEFTPRSGMYNHAPNRAKLREVVRGAYKQLPADGRATLLVVVGREMLSVAYGIMHTDLFQTMFGEYQLRFKPFADDPDYQAGPSFREMLVHGSKHRRAGCIAGLRIAGVDEPSLHFYAIDNPYGYETARIPHAALSNVLRFVFDAAGRGEQLHGLPLGVYWERMTADGHGPTRNAF